MLPYEVEHARYSDDEDIHASYETCVQLYLDDLYNQKSDLEIKGKCADAIVARINAVEADRDTGLVLDERNRRALLSFGALHTARTKEVPGAFALAFDITPIEVDGEDEQQYFLRSWDMLYSSVMYISHEKAKREAEKNRKQ